MSFIRPNGYNPYYMGNYGQQQSQSVSQMAQMQQPMYQQPQMQMPIQQQNQSIQYEMPLQYLGYANLKEVESYMLYPNQKAIFIDKANGMVYEKVCNNDGISSTTCFKRVDLESENKAIEPQKENTIDLSSYVKKEELGQFVSLKQYNELNDKLEQLKRLLGGENGK